MINGKTFAPFLEETRQKRGYSVHHCAKQAGVSEQEYRAWANGTSQPTKVHLRRMFGPANNLEHYLASDEVYEAAPKGVTPPPLPKAAPGSLGAMAHALTKAGVLSITPPTALPWNEVLRVWRKENGLSAADLGELLELSGSAVENWERAVATPIAIHVDKLRKLVPPLATVVIPESKTMAKPGPAQGAESSVTPAPAVIVAPLPVLAATLDPLAAIDRVVMAFDALGQTVGLAPWGRAPDGRWQVQLVLTEQETPLAEGLGVSLSSAALAMLGSLRASFAARQEQTQQIVRAASARLDAQSKALAAIDGALGVAGAPA